jgi:uncharacterized protein
LVYAARQGDLASAKLLVAAGADVNKRTGDGSTALLVATMNGNYELGNFLIERGADVNIASTEGYGPLYVAVANRNYNRGTLPINTADKVDSLTFIKTLLDKGAIVNDTRPRVNSVHRGGDSGRSWLDEAGATPFVRAAHSGDMTLVRLLLTYGADPNLPTYGKTTPLMAASGIGWANGITQERSEAETLQVMKLLVDLGADVNAANWEGRTALMGAAQKGSNIAVEYLVEQGASLTAKDNVRSDISSLYAGCIALDYAEGIGHRVSSPQARPDTIVLIKKLMTERGLPIPISRKDILDGKATLDVIRGEIKPKQ